MFHREGRTIITITLAVCLLLIFGAYMLQGIWVYLLGTLALVLLVLVLQFFRNPKRVLPEKNDRIIYAPADGKVVVIEEVHEPEYYQANRKQVSIFMSPVNVHVNRNPISGLVKLAKYHPGKYLVAWHPKSSTENERTSIVLENTHGSLLMRQIAGALARRIIFYSREGQQVQQGEDFGFIRFGSRVDLFLPLDAEIAVGINEVVYGNKTVIARFK